MVVVRCVCLFVAGSVFYVVRCVLSFGGCRVIRYLLLFVDIRCVLCVGRCWLCVVSCLICGVSWVLFVR